MSRLFSAFSVRGLSLRNRIVMPPMANNLATDLGEVTDQLVQHYERRAGSVGLIIVEHAYAVPGGRINRNQLGIYDDRLVPGLARLATAIHAAGGVACIQITHGGSAAASRVTGEAPVAPSPVPNPAGGETPRELGAEELKSLILAFGQAARRAKAAGFDAVEVHGAHGYLLNQFYSPLTNRRQDAYGGSREGRFAFLQAVVKEVRSVVGPDYPVFFRLGADDRLPGGLTVEDAVWAAPRLAEAGVDLLDLSGGFSGSRPPDLKGQGYFAYLSEPVKRVSPVPVLVTGGITDPAAAEALLAEGKADLIGVGRGLLADPDWALKASRVLE
jgi:2,4-dienoyl-CoA reductase-like NADH-dependent reductase (Old Yellow Enzyme family)